MQRIQYHRYGPSETMRLEPFAPGTPGPKQVLVRVKAAALNPIDWKLRQGELKFVTGRTFPRGMGSDFAGVVEAVGANVTRFKPGDAVLGMASLKESGAFASAVLANEGFGALKPDAVTFEAAAALLTVGVTAWNGLFDKARLRRGQRVFVNGCTGGVGQAAVQLARLAGAELSGSCRASKREAAIAAGVRQVYDYASLDVTKLKAAYDVVFDTSGVLPMRDGLAMIRPGGVYVDIHPTPGKMIRAAIDKRLKVVVCAPRPEILEGLASAARDGHLKIKTGETATLDRAIPLITDVEKGLGSGEKAMIVMA